ncbi:MAG: S8 family serine peptidase, partial [Acidimicrobiia bacterium]
MRLAPRSTRHRTVVSTLAVALLLLPVAPLAAEGVEEPATFERLGRAQDDTAPHSRSHILVRIAVPAQAFRALGTGFEDVGHDWFEVPVPAGWEPIDWAGKMASRPGVEAAELDLIFSHQATPPFSSSDFLYTTSSSPMWQWHLHAANVGAAWQSTVGAGVTVAVLDTGVSEGSDGFCQPFVAEYNAVTQGTGPGAANDTDIQGHGSHVAGSVAQCSDNAVGGAGMAPGANIMPVEVFSGDSASTGAVVRGIDWAVANGARVINMSLGCNNCASTALNEAIERAAAAGVLMVASSGNLPIDVFYPANHPAVIGVGASTRAGNVADYSARGLGLDLLGPGGDESGFVWQDTIGGYNGLAGTSMAAAHVSGAAALLISRFPSALSGQVRNALTCSAVDIGSSGWDGASGFGRLDAGAAVEQLRMMIGAGTLSCVGQAASNAPFASIQTNAGFWRLYRGPAQVAGFYFGDPGDFGFMGDWDCDG